MLIGMTENRFLYVTTSEKKNGFLLIEVYRKFFNPHNYGHQDLFLCGLFLYVRVSKNYEIGYVQSLQNNVIVSLVSILSQKPYCLICL